MAELLFYAHLISVHGLVCAPEHKLGRIVVRGSLRHADSGGITEPRGDVALRAGSFIIRSQLLAELFPVDIIRILRTWIVIFAGELFFRAETLTDGFKMFGAMFRNFSLSILWNGTALGWGLDKADWIVILFSLIIVIVINVIREKGTDITDSLLKKPMALRWALTFGLIFIILIFGLYGPGYQEVDLIYAGF